MYVSHWIPKDMGGKINFEFYRSGDKHGEVVWVLYDPDTDYYMRRVVNVDVVKHKNLDKHIASLIPADLDEKYRESFEWAVRENYLSLFSVHHSSPADYAAQIPGLFVEVKNPVNGKCATIHDIIIELNDAHRWTRDQIADWLETLDENPIITPPREDD